MKYLIIFLLVGFTITNSIAQSTQFFTTNGVAIRGYDPVAYFTDGAPVLGVKDFNFTWQNTEWRFKNKANLDLFKSNPEKYAPQFGGYCAYGVSENHKSPTEPAAFTVLDGKLYLNYNMDVKKLWSVDMEAFIKKAELFWVELKNKKD